MTARPKPSDAPFIHESAVVCNPRALGPRTKVWHFCHVMAGAHIGADSTLGQNVFVADGARVGARCKIQNNVSLYAGVTLEDDVFCGPSAVFTNVANPRAEISRRDAFVPTLVRRGATIGANATIVCGAVIGRHAFVGAGAVVARQIVPDYALMIGVPAQRAGWVGRHGASLVRGARGALVCRESGLRYAETKGTLRCLDLDEDAPLSPTPDAGKQSGRRRQPRSR